MIQRWPMGETREYRSNEQIAEKAQFERECAEAAAEQRLHANHVCTPECGKWYRKDFAVRDEGTIVLLTPQSEEARTWVAENLPEEAMTWGAAVVIEHRYADDIITGIEADGLTVGVA